MNWVLFLADVQNIDQETMFSLFGGEYPFIQTADVKEANLYLTEYSETYNEKGLKQSKLWKAGTLCITIAANIADTAILGIDACFSR